MARVRDRHGRVVFSGGNNADAEKYLADHFPHLHANPGETYQDEDGNNIDPTPDAVVEYDKETVSEDEE
jgi:hypothetical protein